MSWTAEQNREWRRRKSAADPEWNAATLQKNRERNRRWWASMTPSQREARRVARNLAYQNTSPEIKAELQAKSRAYHLLHREELRIKYLEKKTDPAFLLRQAQYRRERHAQNPRLKSAQHRKSLYGMTQKQFDDLVSIQGSKCAICKMKFSTSGGPRGLLPHVDHCHMTGKIRSLLCGKCNTGIGQFDESETRLLSAVEYLRKHK